MISQVFASVLRSGRAEFNKRFAEARRVCPTLDAAVFSRFLETCADPLVVAVNQVRPDQTATTASALYDVSLELLTQGLAGAGKYQPLIEAGWNRVLVPAAAMVADSPARAIASICNALHHLATTPSTRPEQWIAELEGMAPQCKDLETLLRVGQVTAWRAGLAHFREGAIAAADALPEQLALRAVGSSATAGWGDVRQRLLADPWFDPSNTVVPSNSAMRVAAEAGAFRGFGGLFLTPPEVTNYNGHFYVRSDGEVWLLTADIFGSTFHRASAAEFEAGNKEPELPPGWRVGRNSVANNREVREFSGSGELASFAVNQTTLALTFRFSHSVTLVPLR